MTPELFERLEKWPRSVRVRDDDPTLLQQIDRTTAIERFIAFGLDATEQSLDSAAVERITEEMRGLHASMNAMAADLRDRMRETRDLVDRLGPDVIGIPLIIAHWVSHDRDMRRHRETQEQAEDRILDELEDYSDALWAARRREVFPDQEGLPTGPDISYYEGDDALLEENEIPAAQEEDAR
jgi:hypothetical protein